MKREQGVGDGVVQEFIRRMDLICVDASRLIRDAVARRDDQQVVGLMGAAEGSLAEVYGSSLLQLQRLGVANQLTTSVLRSAHDEHVDHLRGRLQWAQEGKHPHVCRVCGWRGTWHERCVVCALPVRRRRGVFEDAWG